MAKISAEKGDERIGRRIRQLREERGMSQRVLAEAVAVSQSSIARLESGKAMVSVFTIREIAKVLKVSTSTLLDEKRIDFDISEMAGIVEKIKYYPPYQRHKLVKIMEGVLDGICGLADERGQGDEE
ncbi:MAG: helix-turn-helix transcriptional regulator [Hungatella sp.]|nr:helix-turn-helix transcriptional regulator [Hungatella sp.]